MSSPIDARETRASAAEVKFLVDADTGQRIREWARARLRPDPHGGGELGDQYRTSSVYFDTPHFDVFCRRRSFGRVKHRIRRYGCSGSVFLERKLSTPGLVAKRRTRIPIEALERLLWPAGDDSWEGDWFRRRLQVRSLRPVCQISYLRTARVMMADEGPIRLTLDEDVRALAADNVRFTGHAGLPALGGQLVLELKYAGQMPPLFRDLMGTFGLIPQSASKYRLGVAALGCQRGVR